MSTDDDAARLARAKRLHAEIDAVTGLQPQSEPIPASPPRGPATESPREFIRRRMKELENEKKGENG